MAKGNRVMNFYETLNLHGHGPQTQNEYIDFNKFFSSVQKTPKNKQKRCFICGQKNIEYCNSHTIPHFVLKNIATNGKLNNTQIFNSALLFASESGLNNTQTFHSICKVCDNNIFKEYETPENIKKEPNQEIMKQIALKNHISRLYKNNKEKRTYNYVLNAHKNTPNAHFAKTMAKHYLPVTEYNCCYNRRQAKRIIKNLSNDVILYKLCYYRKLDYVVPYTIQSNSILSFGFNNELLVNSFKDGDLDIADDIHLCIYPLENQSIILIFCSTDINDYDNFFAELKTKKVSEQLSIINFITFAYFENIYLHKDIDQSTIDNDSLQKLTHEQFATISYRGLIEGMSQEERNQMKLESLENNFSISNHFEIPNLLDKKNKIID